MYPIWMLQDVRDEKPGVTVLNISLFANEDYRKQIFAEPNIPGIQENQAVAPDKDSLFTLRKRILRKVIEMASRTVFLAITLDSR